MGTCGQPGYVFRDFCLKQGIEFIIFCLKQDIIVLHKVWFRVKCLKQGFKNRNSVLNRVGKSAIFVLNRVRVWGDTPHLPTQGYIEYPPGLWAVLYITNYTNIQARSYLYANMPWRTWIEILQEKKIRMKKKKKKTDDMLLGHLISNFGVPGKNPGFAIDIR